MSTSSLARARVSSGGSAAHLIRVRVRVRDRVGVRVELGRVGGARRAQVLVVRGLLHDDDGAACVEIKLAQASASWLSSSREAPPSARSRLTRLP